MTPVKMLEVIPTFHTGRAFRQGDSILSILFKGLLYHNFPKLNWVKEKLRQNENTRVT